MEISITSEQVLLSDFDECQSVLDAFLISDTEEESDAQDMYFESLSAEEQMKYKDHNWERIFNAKHFKNDWVTHGDWVQATFLELRAENVRKVRFFTTAPEKNK